eukprot:5131225-Ditylum_brightwellii.AAC.3
MSLWNISCPLILRDAYLDKDTNALYVCCSTNGCYTQHKRVEGHMSIYSPTISQLPAPPQSAVFTPIRRFWDQVICTGLIDSFMLDHQSCAVELSSFTAYLSSLDLVLQWLLGNLSQQDIDIDFWISALQAGTVEVALDGSMKEGCRTYAVIFKSGDKFIRFQGPVDCHLSLLQSYRTELMDILAIYYLLKYLRAFSTDTLKCKITAHVDSITVVNSNNQKKCFPGITAHTASGIDLLQEIWVLQGEHLKVKMKWVESYLDTT